MLDICWVLFNSILNAQSYEPHASWALYNFVAVTLLLFKLSKGTATMINLSTHQVISMLGLPCM